jgi:hypothetical protein
LEMKSYIITYTYVAFIAEGANYLRDV